MKGGRGSNGAPTDLLVCFPSRAHLALMPPKHICSPSRPAAAEKRRHSTSRAGPPASSPLFKARNPKRRTATTDIPVDDEPTSPKVTCAGQIKARPAKPKGLAGGKAKKPTWLEALGLKKEAVPFLNALHGAFRFNVAGCFGSFPGAVDYTSGEDDDNERTEKETEHSAALAKWFMVLEEGKKDVKKQEHAMQEQEQQGEKEEEEEVAPPKNALMLMRCRSAPARGWLRREGGEEEERGEDEEEEEEEVKSAKKMREEEKEKEKLVLMSYAPDFFKVSVDIAKETWVAGGGGVGGDDAFLQLRCRSWKR